MQSLTGQHQTGHQGHSRIRPNSRSQPFDCPQSAGFVICRLKQLQQKSNSIPWQIMHCTEDYQPHFYSSMFLLVRFYLLLHLFISYGLLDFIPYCSFCVLLYYCYILSLFIGTIYHSNLIYCYHFRCNSKMQGQSYILWILFCICCTITEF